MKKLTFEVRGGALKSIIRRLIPLACILPLYNFYQKIIYLMRGIKVNYSHGLFRIYKNDKEIRLSKIHQCYLVDTLRNFDFYFDGIIASKTNGYEIVDYSKPAWHEVKDFDLMPVYFNAVSEPMITTNQYIEFSNLKEKSVVIDLGAYSGLTSIILDREVGLGGFVIAVEADKNNYEACIKNLSLYEKLTKRKINLVNAAIWKDTNGIMFSSEGNMGSSVVDIVGNDRGENIFVRTVTLMSIVDDFKLRRVDFIKCDIEGAETIALNSPDFFSIFKPRVVIECHIVDGVSTQFLCQNLMENFGYLCELREQLGYPLPLLFCEPK